MSSSSEDNKISCNVVADNCDIQYVSIKVVIYQRQALVVLRDLFDTVNPGGSWQCSSNPFGFDVGISQTAGSDLTELKRLLKSNVFVMRIIIKLGP